VKLMTKSDGTVQRPLNVLVTPGTGPAPDAQTISAIRPSPFALYGFTGADAMDASGAPPPVATLANDEADAVSADGATGALAVQATAKNVDSTTSEARNFKATSSGITRLCD
jgi:hypothetical protein